MSQKKPPSARELVERIESALRTSARTTEFEGQPPVSVDVPPNVPELRPHGDAFGGRAWARLPLAISGPSIPGAEPLASIPFRDSYDVTDLLRHEDEAFVRAAYRAVLHREPDAAGLSEALHHLRKGTVGKCQILDELRSSQEGLRVGVTLKGLDDALRKERSLRRIMAKVPKTRALGRWLTAARHLSRTHARVERARQDRAQDLADVEGAIETRLERLATELERIFDGFDSRIGELASQASALADTTRSELTAAFESLRSSQMDIVALRAQVRAQHDLINAHERRMAQLLQETRRVDAAPEDAELASVLERYRRRRDELYTRFEDRFRGTREDVQNRLGVYVPRLEALRSSREHPTALDLGCGRGEWLSVLLEAGFAANGVDSAASMVDVCRAHGLQATQDDALAHLRSVPNTSVDLVSAFHLVEHLPFELVIMLVEEAHRVLRPGGMLLLETPNPENLVVGAHTFYLDPTHRNPIPPATLEFFVSECGFARTEVLRLHPRVRAGEPHAVELAPITQLLEGPQDYSVIAYKD